MVNARNGPKAAPAEAVSQIAVYAGTPGRRPARQALPISTQILAERLGLRVPVLERGRKKFAYSTDWVIARISSLVASEL